MIEKWIKQDILKQQPYSVKMVDHKIKLNQNESPWDWPDDIKKVITDRLFSVEWNRYPSLNPERLRATIASYHSLSANQVLIGNGSNEILQAIMNATILPGDYVCTLSPTFTIYRILAEQRGGRIISSFLSSSLEVDSTDLLAKSSKSRLTIICNPNSPTGTFYPLSSIEMLLKNTPGLVVIDEAYADFSGKTVMDFLSLYPNLIITRTFSKAFALAGFRVGYGLMAPDLAIEIQKCLLPFHFDIPSMVALETILDYPGLVRKRVTKIIKERDRLITELNLIEGISALGSHTNFFLLKSTHGAEKIFEFLANKSILIRDVSSYPGLEAMVRITVGTPDENNTLIRAFQEMS